MMGLKDFALLFVRFVAVIEAIGASMRNSKQKYVKKNHQQSKEKTGKKNVRTATIKCEESK